MTTTWCVTMTDIEKNFPSKSAAVAYLRARTSDRRIKPIIVRRCKGAYTFYGLGRNKIVIPVLTANIDRLDFSSVQPRK